ncbi:Hpt domain-containing protein [Tropicimonas sp.]|uniref:Hpt domain-containing protein n=1 Tax=Tropicimonas sp. TaxID=2067044 RepID=UPI003A84B53F
MIDWKRVAELRAEIGAPEFEEVVDLFLEEVDGATARLRTAPIPESYETDLHFIKGCAVNLGFEALAGLCLTGETVAARGQAELVDIAAILDTYDTSRAMFLDGIAAGLAA